MAYNREWDRGKQFNNDSSSSWRYQGSRSSRDDDYYTEGKRRKYNTGVRLLIVLAHPNSLHLSCLFQ